MNYGPHSQGGFRPGRSRDPGLGSGSRRDRDPRLEGGPPPAFRDRDRDRDPRSFDGPEEPYDEEDDRSPSPPPVIDVAEIRGVQFARDRLLPWFRKIVDSVEEAQNPLRVTLVQRVAKGGTQEVTTLDHDLETPPDDTINQLLQLAVEDMCEAHFTGTKLTYSLIVPLSNGNNSLQNFVLEIPRPRGTAFADPPRAQHFPDVGGVIGHFMDRDLQLTQFALEGASRGTEVLEREIERKIEEVRQLKQENARLRGSQFDRDREMQILLDGNMKREFMAEEHRSKIDRDAKIGEGFKAIMPQLLPLILPQGMAQALAVPLAMATNERPVYGRAGAAGEERGGSLPDDESARDPAHGAPPVDMASMPSMPGMPNDTALIDELIREFEEDQTFFVKLFTLMGERPRCAQLLAMLYESSRIRQQRRAQMQAEQSGRTKQK